MPHYKALYDKEYLGSWDLPPGKDATVTIEKVVAGELDNGKGKKNKKPIISFVGKEKKFVANVTNAKTIAGMYGNMTEDWIGKRITLYVTQTRDPSTGGEIDCLRIRPKVPSGKAAAAGAGASKSAEPSLTARIAACATAAELDAITETMDEDTAAIYFDTVARRKGELSEGL